MPKNEYITKQNLQFVSTKKFLKEKHVDII